MKTKIKKLVRPQRFDQNELESDLVTPFCSSGYSSSSSSVSCNGYTLTWWGGVSNPEEEDDILI